MIILLGKLKLSVVFHKYNAIVLHKANFNPWMHKSVGSGLIALRILKHFVYDQAPVENCSGDNHEVIQGGCIVPIWLVNHSQLHKRCRG
jgi:hypothetical protein